MKKFLGILVFYFLSLGTSFSIEANEFGKCKQHGTVESYCKDPSKFHKKWAREILHKGIKDKDRFLNNLTKWTGKSSSEVKIKPKLLNFIGVKKKDSMRSFRGKGEMGVVIGAEEFAFKGKEFWTVTADFSKCVSKDGFSDCKQSYGSSRKEIRENGWSMKDGDEKWIHYAIKPVHNILFPGNLKRRFTMGQCHPSDQGGHLGLTWMLRIRGGKLYFVQYFKHQEFNYLKQDGSWCVRKRRIGEDVSWKTTHDELYDFRPLIKKNMNGVGADGKWTSVLIRHVNSTKEDGKFEVYLNGDWINPVYEYSGATTIKKKKKCYFKFGLYTNGNMSASDMATAENMTIHLDAMIVGKTKDEVLNLVKKDK